MTPDTATDIPEDAVEEPTRAPVDLERALEAVLIVADEPMPLVSLATASSGMSVAVSGVIVGPQAGE